MKPEETRGPVEVCREEMSMHRAILDALRDGEQTVPELAAALALPAAEVMVWLMGMRRYGLVAESAAAKDDDYFTYRIANKHEGEAP